MDTTNPLRAAGPASRGTALAMAATLMLAAAPFTAGHPAVAAPTSEPAAPAAPAAPGAPEPDGTSAPDDSAPEEESKEEETVGPAPGRRDTRDCAYRTTPPPAVDSSEVPAPGSPTPDPLPVPATPAGGPRMADCDVVAARGFTAPEDVAASAWIVFDAGSGDVIAAKDPHGRYRPASIAKVLLALVAIDELPMDRTITVRHEDAAIEGSRPGILEGVDYTSKSFFWGC